MKCGRLQENIKLKEKLKKRVGSNMMIALRAAISSLRGKQFKSNRRRRGETKMWCQLNLVYYRLDRHHTQPITIWFHLGSSHCIASPLVYNSLLF